MGGLQYSCFCAVFTYHVSFVIDFVHTSGHKTNSLIFLFILVSDSVVDLKTLLQGLVFEFHFDFLLVGQLYEFGFCFLYRGASPQQETWTGTWFPHSTTVKPYQHNPKDSRVPMGVRNPDCDDAQVNEIRKYLNFK